MDRPAAARAFSVGAAGWRRAAAAAIAGTLIGLIVLGALPHRHEREASQAQPAHACRICRLEQTSIGAPGTRVLPLPFRPAYAGSAVFTAAQPDSRLDRSPASSRAPPSTLA